MLDKEVVDGDIWFFCKCIADNGRIGILKVTGYINIFGTSSGGTGKKFTTSSSVKVQLTYKQTENLISYLEECSEKSINTTEMEWGKYNTYITRFIELEHGAEICTYSLHNGKVTLSILNTDKLGSKYMRSANKIQYTFTPEGLKEFINYAKIELAKVTDKDKQYAAEYELKKTQDKLATKISSEYNPESWHVSKCISIKDLQKRISEYLIKYSTDPGNTELTLEYPEMWQDEGPNIVIRPKK